MKILAILFGVHNPEDKKVYVQTRYYDLSSVGYFYKNTVKETFKFVIRESLPTLDKGTRHSVQHEEYYCHILVSSSDQIAAYIFCDQDYPRRLAYAALQESMDIFKKNVGDNWKKFAKDENIPVSSIEDVLKKYQDPSKVDKLSQAQKNVDETKIILHDNIKKLLERQGDLDTLVAKSNDLSKGAKVFYKNTKKINKSCCNIF